MNNIKATKAINEQELKLGIKASWHDDYKDSAYIYIGGLDTGLTEGDIITIFSQYGEPVHIDLPKKKAGQAPGDKTKDGPSSHNNNNNNNSSKTKPKTESRGFCFLMYENQLSTNLAVDNLNGAVVLGRTLRVDHCKNYKQLERNQDGKMVERDADLGEKFNARPELHLQNRPTDSPPHRSTQSDRDDSIDPEDPMAAYLLQERRKRRKDHAPDHPLSSDQKDAHKKQKKRRGSETEEERAARKDAKRIKKLLKEIGSSKTQDHHRRDEVRDSKQDRSPRRQDYDRYDARDRRNDRSPRGDRDRYQARDHGDYRRSDR
ncbi:hypothetical protein PCASD_23824 [Puccinia coronata f. sp. avenae]|uniref:RRM domain-containing protein n=1 Tax=Puccinia coronata f. sp. avenae TaxID=200324 RepID=A0A2N5S5G7_9BASI|nr:hypothetical protein PCASD_23824 [Puccinia coronata f. sp. avenae]